MKILFLILKYFLISNFYFHYENCVLFILILISINENITVAYCQLLTESAEQSLTDIRFYSGLYYTDQPTVPANYISLLRRPTMS